MTGRVLVLLTRSLLAAATTIAVLATPVSATADGSGGLSGEVLSLDLGGLNGCAAGASSYSFTATGSATGSVVGPVQATISNSVTDGTQVSTISFSVSGGELQGTQTATGAADQRGGACALPGDGTTSSSGSSAWRDLRRRPLEVGRHDRGELRHRHRHARLRRRPAHRHPEQPGAGAVTDRHAQRHSLGHADGPAHRHAHTHT